MQVFTGGYYRMEIMHDVNGRCEGDTCGKIFTGLMSLMNGRTLWDLESSLEILKLGAIRTL